MKREESAKTHRAHIAMDRDLFDRVSAIADKAGQITGLKITKERIVKAMVDNFTADLLRKYDAAIIALRKEKLL